MLLVLLIMLPALSIFHAVSTSSPVFTGSQGQSYVLVAKEDYVYARVYLQVEPAGNGSVGVDFDGTSYSINRTTTLTFVLANQIYYSFSQNGVAGEGYQVSSSEPLALGSITGPNATEGLYLQAVPAQGVHLYWITIRGLALVSVQAFGISL